MQNKPVLITGCSSGIGLNIAGCLRDRGYRVFASARKPEDVARLQQQGYESLRLDLDSSESIQNAINEILTRTDRKLYGLINNGAYGQPGAVEDLSRNTLREQFETNLFGTQELTNAVLPVMREQGYGRIVQISSLLGFVCLSYRGAYNASKYALEALSDTLRLELRDTDIHISLVEPGPITSKFRDNALAAFRKNINIETSAHRARYQALLKRLEGKGGSIPFTLPPEAVTKKVMLALEARRPRIRYPVTFPTYLFAFLKRILPMRWLDNILYKVSGSTSK